MRPKPAIAPLLPRAPAETEPCAMIRGETKRSLVRISNRRKSTREWTPDQPAHLRGPGLRNTQGMPRQGWMTRKPLASQEASTCRHVASNLRHRMRRPADSHSGVWRSANQPLTIHTVLDAIQHCLDFMRSRRSVEQTNWDLSTQRAVGRREPMRRFFPIAQDIDRLR